MQWGKDRPPTGSFEGFSPASLNSANTPAGYNPSSPFFPQYGGPSAMSPTGRWMDMPEEPHLTTPGPPQAGRGAWDPNQMQGNFGQTPNQQYSPAGYGRGQQPSPGGHMYQQPSVTNYGGY